MNLNNLTIKEASEKLQNNEITSVQLTEACLDKIEKRNPELNAFITVLEKEALELAEASDERRAKGDILSPIDGVPIALKDNMCMLGTKTTAASKILENFMAPYDATVVTKLKDAGAVILGKTNMDEFAMGSSTENSAFGVTKNPHNISRVPGGSSGGSAAAVAGDLCVAAIGSDTGGSIRQPASFCGIVGFKPTYGAVSRYGLLAMASSLDQIGPMTKTAEDAEILFKIIAGPDEKDATSLSFPTGPRQDRESGSPMSDSVRLEDDMKNIKIGIPKEYFAEGLDESVKEKIKDAIEQLKSLGAEIIDISLPNTKYALSCYYIVMPVEVASNLSRYDGIKFGLSADKIQDTRNKIQTLLDNYIMSRSIGFGAEAKRRIILGTYASSAGYVDQYYNKAQAVREMIKQDFQKAFEEVDFIMGPVTPTTAFKIGEKTNDPLEMYLSDIYTIAVNMAGLPAISIPLKTDGLPVGLQIIGPQKSDLQILELAKIYEADHGVSRETLQ